MKCVRWAAIAVLGFLGLSSFAGCVPMIIDPSGNLLRMPLWLLRYSPFQSFLIPGIILFGANGLLAAWVLWLALRRAPGHGFWTVVQGCVLLGWLAVECWMLRTVMWAHWLYAAVVVCLIVTGGVLWRTEIRNAPQTQSLASFAK